MGSKASEKKRGFFNAIKPDTMWQDEFPIVIKGALHPNLVHIHTHTPSMHTNEMKSGEPDACRCSH